MWKYFQCAVIGRGHEQRNIPCQDKTYVFEYDDVHAIALADGAGSAKFSHHGASRITEFICKEICENFDLYYDNNNGIEVKKYIIKTLCEELEELSLKLKCDLEDLASTLLFVAVKEKKYIIGHIGDGVIGYIKKNELKVATHPDNGEFANTTHFVTSINAATSFKLLKGYNRNGITGFVAFSDGTESSFYNKREKEIGTGLKNIMSLVKVANHETIFEKIYNFFYYDIRKKTLDDCSIVIMVDDHNDEFENIDIKEKADILLINNYQSKSKIKATIKRYEQILNHMAEPLTLRELGKKIHLKKRYVRKRIKKLIETNLVEFNKGKWISLLKPKRSISHG